MAVNPQTLEFVEDQLAGVGPVMIRRMFGGAGVFADGLMFALIADEVLYFKVDDISKPAFEAEGSEAFSYETKTGRNSIMSYWRVPERLFDDSDEMAVWANEALAAARRVAARRPKNKKKR